MQVSTNVLRSLVDPAEWKEYQKKLKENTGVSAATSGGSTGFGDISGASGRADRVTAGGQRAININVAKFMDKVADKVEMKTNSWGAFDDTRLEGMFTEWFLRILNSANAINLR